jgi:hypothetical protein
VHFLALFIPPSPFRLPDSTGSLVPVHRRHPQIHPDQVRLISFMQIDRFLPAGGFQNTESTLFQ